MSDWWQTTIGELLTLEYGKPLPEKARDGQGFPVYGSNGIVGYHSQAMVKGPGIVVGRKGSSGTVNFSEGDFSPIDTAFYVLVKDSTQIGMEFAYHLLVNAKLTELTTQTGVPGLTRSRAYEIRVALPPVPLQERIVEVISAVDDQITALEAEAVALEGMYRAATSLLWRTSQGDEAEPRPLSDVMHLDIARTPMESGTTYHLAGVLNSGKGLVDKEAFDGADTEYKAMNILRKNQVVMRKLTAWEGPITVVPAEFDGFVASNEFPTFTLASDIDPGWMKHVCRTPRLWAEMQSRVVGTVQRRKRLNPDQLLIVTLPVPHRREQEQAADALDAIEGQVATLRTEADRLRNVRAGLLSGLLDRTIDIESAELGV
ncbi:restriction endonuclease subunit S [Streptomyces sp. NPDC091290]|uniref:restriction endonuclease subunit S n=1 Tax=Streptomyces sp. NPDC091290 TaxID=3365990 RepID=UPI003479600D